MIRLTNETGELVYELIRLAISGRDRLPEPMRSWDWETVRQSIIEQRNAPEHAADLVDVISNHLASGNSRGGIQGDSLRKMQRAILLPSELVKLRNEGPGGPTCAACRRELRHFEMVAITDDNRIICAACDMPAVVPLMGPCRRHVGNTKFEEITTKAVRAIRAQIKAHADKPCPGCVAEMEQQRADMANGVQPAGPTVIQMPNGASITLAQGVPEGTPVADDGSGQGVQAGTVTFRLRDAADDPSPFYREIVRADIPGDPSPVRQNDGRADGPIQPGDFGEQADGPPMGAFVATQPGEGGVIGGTWPDIQEASNQAAQTGAAGGTTTGRANPFSNLAQSVWDGRTFADGTRRVTPPPPRPRDPRVAQRGAPQARMGRPLQSLEDMLNERDREHREMMDRQAQEANRIMRQMRDRDESLRGLRLPDTPWAADPVPEGDDAA